MYYVVSTLIRGKTYLLVWWVQTRDKSDKSILLYEFFFLLPLLWAVSFLPSRSSKGEKKVFFFSSLLFCYGILSVAQVDSFNAQ